LLKSFHLPSPLSTLRERVRVRGYSFISPCGREQNRGVPLNSFQPKTKPYQIPQQVQFTLILNNKVFQVAYAFQSLTGSIHTGNVCVYDESSWWFQSLTGSIHTLTFFIFLHLFSESFNPSQVQFTRLQKRISSERLNFVSIPHRFNSHIKIVIVYAKQTCVSIPHRFNSHTPLVKELNNFFTLFQSLTGSIHTDPGAGKLKAGYLSFNPSQVQFTLAWRKRRTFSKLSFNPSQVQFTLSSLF
jgi:hypothetical protein